MGNTNFNFPNLCDQIVVISEITDKMMVDPKEKNPQLPDENDEEAKRGENETNWDEHQQVDEEGNEVKPEDIK